MLTLQALKIQGISSMIRDLSLLSPNPLALEQEIQRGGSIRAELFQNTLVVDADSKFKPRAGDCVVFRPRCSGAYSTIETLWGKQIPLSSTSHYIGVLCNRISSKLICGAVPRCTCSASELDVQLIAQAGGLGEATGFSPALARDAINGVAPDVEVLGYLRSIDAATPLNLASARTYTQVIDDDLMNLAPTILVLGSGTDVGKTTVASALINQIVKSFPCAAIKASGTGWYEDSELHRQGGAEPSLAYTFAGLPTTYDVSEHEYLQAVHCLYYWVNNPSAIPVEIRHPSERLAAATKPSAVVIEHGGDILEGNVPTFLQSPTLMRPVSAIILCSESALSLAAMCQVLLDFGVHSSKQRRIYAALPHTVNPEGFMSRIRSLPVHDMLHGILDITKPILTSPKSKRCFYTRHYDEIVSVNEFVAWFSDKLSTQTPTPIKTDCTQCAAGA